MSNEDPALKKMKKAKAGMSDAKPNPNKEDEKVKKAGEPKEDVSEEKGIVSDFVWKFYTTEMFPARPLKGKLLDLLKEELQAGFTIDPDNPEDDEPDPFDTSENILKFCKLCDGLTWLNALHQFEEPDCDESYMWNSVDDEDEEEFNERMEKEREFGGKYTPLTYVLEKDSDDWRTVEMLLGIGADPNLRDGKGRPPLFQAVLGESGMGPRWKTVYYLLESGANPLAAYAGKTIALWAKELAREDSEESRRMIWDSIKQKCNIPDDEEDEGSSDGW